MIYAARYETMPDSCQGASAAPVAIRREYAPGDLQQAIACYAALLAAAAIRFTASTSYAHPALTITRSLSVAGNAGPPGVRSSPALFGTLAAVWL